MGCTELLLQADDTSSMVRWLKALQEQALEAQAPLSAEEVSAFRDPECSVTRASLSRCYIV